MATLTSYLSIWAGIIIVGFLLFPNQWLDTVNAFNDYLSSPTESFVDFLARAFDVKGIGFYIGSIMFLGIAATMITNIFSGGGMSLLFLIPALLVFTTMTMLLSPMTVYVIMVSETPFEIKIIYSLFMGILTFLTLISFTGGRS